MKFLHLTLFAAVGTLALSACGSSSHTMASKTTANGAINGSMAASLGFNSADVTFAQGMVPHHQQAVEMADIALDPTVGASEKVRNLATEIKGAQDPEIKLMGGWLTTWGQPMQMDTAMGHNMSSMEGMMSDREMVNLRALKGAAFDTMWIQMMIRHHEGAIAMSQTAKATGSNADAIALADRIIAAQQSEITVMKAMLMTK